MSFYYEIERLYSEILPGLFISGTDDADVLGKTDLFTLMDKEQPFDSVVCLYIAANPAGSYVREQRFAIPDGPISESAKPELMQLAYWLHGEWKAGKKAAGKCQAGWNRSSLVVAIVLLIEGYTAEEAVELIREKRSPNALCNSYFVDHIHEIYENNFRSPSLQAS